MQVLGLPLCSWRSRYGSGLWLNEEGKLTKQLSSGRDKASCNLNRLLSFVGGGCICWQTRIFQLVAPTAEVGKRPEALAKLGPDGPFHRIVASAGGGAQALLRQQSDSGKSCGIVGQDVGAVGIGLDQAGGGGCRPSCLREQRSAVGRHARDMLQFPAQKELLDLCLASLPPGHCRALTGAAASSLVASSGMRTATKGPD